jgi:HAD superfamily hydrolase (TIGR01484 family)
VKGCRDAGATLQGSGNEGTLADMTIEILQDSLGLDSIAEQWNALANRVSTPLLRYEWFRASADAFCPPDKLFVIVGRSGNEITAIAPLVVNSKFHLKRLELLGTEVLGEPSGFLYKDRESLIELTHSILSLRQPLLLKGVSSDLSPNEHPVNGHGFHMRYSRADSYFTPWISIETNWDTYYSTISPERRSSFRRAEKRAKAFGGIAYEIVAPTPGNLDELLHEVFRVEMSGWKSRVGTSLENFHSLGNFFRIYARSAAALGTLRIAFLRCGGMAIAAQLLVEFADRLWVFKIGFDEAYARCSPGILLMNEVVHYAFEKRLTAIEMLGTNQAWLDIWPNKLHEYHNYRIYPLAPAAVVSHGLEIGESTLRTIHTVLAKRKTPSAGTPAPAYPPPSGEIKQKSDENFYASYEWCLNPYLTLRELFRRFGEELDRYPAVRDAWQKEEVTINCYLFACAIACTVDDILAPRYWNLTWLVNQIPRCKNLVRTTERMSNFLPSFSSMAFRSYILHWREQWEPCVEDACRFLLAGLPPDHDKFKSFQTKVKELSHPPLSDEMFCRRMKINEGFRCQDLTHHDVLSLMDKFIATGIDRDTPVTIIGLRTAGLYFAPLAKVYLTSRGFGDVSWMTLRPKSGISHSEKTTLRSLKSKRSHVIVMDDYPNSGDTLLLAFGILQKFGMKEGNITLAVPLHPKKGEVMLKVQRTSGANVIILEHSELHKRKLLEPAAIEPMIREYYNKAECRNVAVREGRETELLNEQLSLHYRDGFQARLKRVYDIHTAGNVVEDPPKRVIGKSVGWGWFGYHAIIIAERLHGFIPKPIGLRNGLLFSEWKEPTGPKLLTDGTYKRFSSYIAARAKRLSLAEDPRFGNPDYGWGWLEIVAMLRRSYGFYTGRVCETALTDRLRKRIHFTPSVIDGSMRPWEWIHSNSDIYKVDFEHHTFGAPELDFVDPAYDLAATVFEFDLSNGSEEELLKQYEKESHDKTVRDRILLYKLVYGSVRRRKAAEFAYEEASHARREEVNKRYIRAHDFLVYTMNRFAAGAIPRQHELQWSDKLFFMDLDGVFDTEVFTFPHTTASGLAALTKLQQNGFSVVLNTGRSVAHVREYCSSYNLQGGLGEYGSVFVDNIGGKEISLIDDEGEKQLNDCREIIGKLPRVFLDPDYRYSIRAYRFRGTLTEGLNAKEIEDVLRVNKFDKLTYISRAADTYIIQRGVDKGAGVRFVKKYLVQDNAFVAAIGDSDEDIPMLEEAGRSYAPRNCSDGITKIAQSRRWNVTKSPHQQGLLEAVNNLIRPNSKGASKPLTSPYNPTSVHDLMFHLLSVAEQSKLKRVFLAFGERMGRRG